MNTQPEDQIEPRDGAPRTEGAQLTKRVAAWSPRLKSRVAGVFEVLEAATSAGGQVVILGTLVVAGDATATAANILAHQPLYWLGFALQGAGVAFHLAWAFLFYELFKPVNRSIAGLAVFVILICCAMQAVTALLYLGPLLVLTGGSSLGAFSAPQLHSLATAFLSLNAAAFHVNLIFFGLWCILTGYLIFRSTFLPRILGVLLMIDGVGWATYLVPPFAIAIFPAIALASGVAELSLMFWLIVVGVNERRWKEQAGKASS
jgi:Domain of unknown function (DUF4386)